MTETITIGVDKLMWLLIFWCIYWFIFGLCIGRGSK